MERRNSTIFVFFALSDSSLGVWPENEFFSIVSPLLVLNEPLSVYADQFSVYFEKKVRSAKPANLS